MNNRLIRFNQSQELQPKWKTSMSRYTHCTLNRLFTLLMTIPAFVHAEESWGWSVHEYINHQAVEYLPPQMSFVLDHQVFLRQRSIDPDIDGSPGNYHYIDIDYYPEFFAGTLPHEWDQILELYDESVVRNFGIVPWVIQWWTDSLSALMSRNQWEAAWQIAANLGHYVADSHQPLHTTLNYNGQSSGNTGIHSRYESQLITPHLGFLPLPEGEAIYWESLIDSVFLYIGEAYSNINWILLADDLAYSQDDSYGSTYYSVMWTELEAITIESIHSAILDLASIWYTAWINAGEPVPSVATEDISYEDLSPARYTLYQNHPNPFNPITNIRYSLPANSSVLMRIFDMSGREVNTIINQPQPAGTYSIPWDGRDYHGATVSSGIYFCRMEAEAYSRTIRMIYLR